MLFLSFFKDSGFIYWEFHFISAVMILCMESLGTELAAAMKTIKPRGVIRPSQEMANRLSQEMETECSLCHRESYAWGCAFCWLYR